MNHPITKITLCAWAAMMFLMLFWNARDINALDRHLRVSIDFMMKSALANAPQSTNGPAHDTTPGQNAAPSTGPATAPVIPAPEDSTAPGICPGMGDPKNLFPHITVDPFGIHSPGVAPAPPYTMEPSPNNDLVYRPKSQFGNSTFGDGTSPDMMIISVKDGDTDYKIKIQRDLVLWIEAPPIHVLNELCAERVAP